MATGQWSDLPPLPEPRSSHDATLIGTTVYVVGGWQLAGGEETVWHSTAWAMDLSIAEPRWIEMPKPPFQRRALAIVAHQGKLFAIGGMDRDNEPTKAVAIFDPKAKTWTEVDQPVGDKPMAGFGAAGWSTEGQLIVTTYEGVIQRWNGEQQNWKAIRQTAEPRFFHRLLPLAHNQLVSIGGAKMGSGKLINLELITVP